MAITSVTSDLVTWDTLGRTTPGGYTSSRSNDSGFVAEVGLFDVHVLEFTGLENLSAFEAFDKLTVLFAGHDLHTRMLTHCHVASLLGG